MKKSAAWKSRLTNSARTLAAISQMMIVRRAQPTPWRFTSWNRARRQAVNLLLSPWNKET